MTVASKSSDERSASSVQPGAWMSVEQVAAFMGIARSTVDQLMDSGKLGYVRVCRRRVVPPECIAAFRAANETKPQWECGADLQQLNGKRLTAACSRNVASRNGNGKGHA
jgi:excisionase family DNA binding protein